MLATGGGAWYFPPQAATRSSRAVLFTAFSFSVASEPGARDQRDREPRKRVLEEVFVRALVEQVLRLDVHPERSGCADADAGIEQQLAVDEGRVEGVARDRGGEARFAVPLEAVAAPREPREEPVRRAIGELVAVGPVHGVEKAVGNRCEQVRGQRDDGLQPEAREARLADGERLDPRAR